MNTRIPRRRRGASLALLAIAGLTGAALTGCAPGARPRPRRTTSR